MNEFERNDAQRVGNVIRATRKLRGLNQAEVSKELQISQVTLSNIEKGQVAISGSLWYRLSNVLKVLPDHTFFEGIVDNINHLDDPLETGFKIPKRYANNAFSTVRTSQPFFRFFERCCGKKELEEFMKERLNVDPDIRFIYNLRLSIRFNCDIALYLIKSGHLKINNLAPITQFLLSPKTHGMPADYYTAAQNPLELIKILVEHISLYERNFTYTIVNKSKRSLDLLSTPAEFMRYFSYKEDELPDFINQYRLSFLESFSGYLRTSQPLRIQIIPSSSKRRTECIFRITT